VRYKILGRSGLRVSELCLGTMTFGEAWGWGAAQPESRRIFNAYAAAGGCPATGRSQPDRPRVSS
jgi:aryl-alcohol dehydrogenase-like predicted oxidoreductase